MDTLDTTTNETHTNDCIDYDPPHFEYVTKANMENFAKDIGLLINDKLGELQLAEVKRLNSPKYYDFYPLALKNNTYSIFVYECFYDESNGKEIRREALGDIIQFSFRQVSENLNVSAIVFDDNVSVIKYFEGLWEWLKSDFPPIGAISTDGIQQNNKPGGRPAYPENTWAYEEVRVNGKNPEDIYPLWLKKAGERTKKLDDSRDSFNKAIRPKRK